MAISDKRRQDIMEQSTARARPTRSSTPRQGRLEDALKRKESAEERHATEQRQRRQARRRAIHDRSGEFYASFALDRLEEAEGRDPRGRFDQIHEREDTDSAGFLEFKPGFLAHLDRARLDQYHRSLHRLAHEAPGPYAALKAVFYDDDSGQLVTAVTRDREQQMATEQGKSLPAFRAQVWAAVSLLLLWTHANVPATIALYALEHRKGIRRRELRRRARAHVRES